MKLSDFKIRQLIFEVRYADSYLLWDCAGRLHSEIARIWPGTSIQEASPNQQALQGDNVSIVTTIANSRIVLAHPTSIAQYSEQISQTVKVWLKYLEVSEFTRIGTRVIYDRPYNSEDASNQAVVDLGLVNYPQAPFFNHKDKPYSVDIRLLWRDDVSQTQIIVRAERHRLEIGGANQFSMEKEVRISDHVVLDIDRATQGLVDVNKFRVTEWLSGVRHLISRDVSKLLETV